MSSPEPLPIPTRRAVQPLLLPRPLPSNGADSDSDISDEPQARAVPRLPWILVTPNPPAFNPHAVRPLLNSHAPKSSPGLPQLPDAAIHAQIVKNYIPKSYDDAITCSDRLKWIPAIQLEYDALIANGTWEMVSTSDLPSGSRPIGGKWVFTIKWDGRYKARYVAKGFAQRFGRDYDETFAPVVNSASTKMLLALACSMGLQVRQFDVPNAFLKGVLKNEVYMIPPKGFATPGMICRLIKTIYGLKQSSKEFYEVLRNFLVSIGFSTLKSDPCVYVKTKGTDSIWIGTHVDDGFYFGTSPTLLTEFEAHLASEFDCVCHDVDTLLGMRIIQNEDFSSLTLDLEDYTIGILEDSGMSTCKGVATPINPALPVQAVMSPLTSSDQDFLSVMPFRRLIGSLLYLCVHARPDIYVAVSKLSSYQDKPQHEHVLAVKRILRYLRGTLNFKITYRGHPDKSHMQLSGYADADWAGCLDTRRSTTGYLVFLGPNLISWASTRQHVVSLSTTEAEYYSTTACTTEILSCRQFLRELGSFYSLNTASDIFRVNYSYASLHNDNQGCLHLAAHPTSHKRTKHIDIRHHFIRELVENKIIKLHYIQTDKMLADIMTKGLHSPQHVTLTQNINSGFIFLQNLPMIISDD